MVKIIIWEKRLFYTTITVFLTTKLQLKQLRSSFAVAHIKYIDAYYNFYASMIAFTNKK